MNLEAIIRNMNLGEAPIPDLAPKYSPPEPDTRVDIKPTRISQAINAANRRNKALNNKTDPDNSGKSPVPNEGDKAPVNGGVYEDSEEELAIFATKAELVTDNPSIHEQPETVEITDLSKELMQRFIVKEGQHSITGIDGKMNVMKPGLQHKKVQPAQSTIKNAIDPTKPPSKLIGNSGKNDYMNATKRKIEQMANEEAKVPPKDVDGVSSGTKERRKLNYVGRPASALPNKTLARTAAYKINVIDEERVMTIKKVLKEREPNAKDDAKDNGKMTSKVIVSKPGATPVIYNPPLNKKIIPGSIN